MRQDLIVSKSILVNENLDKVWNALTNPELIKDYLFGTETITDWKVGSEIVFQGEYGEQKYRDHGVILEYIQNEKLSYSYWSAFTGLEDKPENYSIVNYTLKNKGINQTEFTWTQLGFANEERQQHSESGMDEFLKSIKTVMER